MENLGNSAIRKDMSPLLQSLKEEKVLEAWQSHFCDIVNIFLCCMDTNGIPLTELGGGGKEAERIKKVIDPEQLQNMLLRVSESTLEEQAIETTAYPNLRLAVISVRVEGRPVVNWLACGVLSDVSDTDEYEEPPLEGFINVISEKQFIRAVDVLRDMTTALVRERLGAVNAQVMSQKSHGAEKKMADSLRRAEMLSQVMGLVGNEEPIETVIYRILKSVGDFLGLDAAALYRVKQDEKALEIVAKWYPQDAANASCDANADTSWDTSLGPEKQAVLAPEKPLVLSQSAMAGVLEKEQLHLLGFQAVAIIPIAAGEDITLHALFGQKQKGREWELSEIQFLNDCVKALRIVVRRRIKELSTESRSDFIREILDNLGLLLFVEDPKTGEVLFTNKSMRNTFKRELKTGGLDKYLSEGHEREFYDAVRGRWYSSYTARIETAEGEPAVLGVFQDITEKKLYQEVVERQADTDFLTGLFNRMRCEEDLAEALTRAKESGGRGILLYFDLDDFKHVNDSLGHHYGDMVLKTVSKKIRRVKGIENTCYRMGGDEFVIIIPPEEYRNSEEIISSVKEVFMRPQIFKKVNYHCTMSMGVVEFPAEGEAVQELIQKVDFAMYMAKKKGKNRISRYADHNDAESGKNLDLEAALRRAIEGGCREFEIYYQPIIDIRAEGFPCVGAEALLRWDNKEIGLLQPEDFLLEAEYLGLINPIGDYVLLKACKACKQWNDNGYPDYGISVNLAVPQLLQPDIVEKVAGAVKEAGLVPGNLTLDVTEILAINDQERMLKVLEGLKKLGVKLAFDDFGAGYSSLNHVRELPFDVVKLQQGLIEKLDEDANIRSFVKVVGELAKMMDMELCVEGVETRRQCEILSELPVGMVQGFYFDCPMLIEAFQKKYTPNIH